ncbi:MAG: VWA domain-containing protein [Pyrinomonadaceae bacterium]
MRAHYAFPLALVMFILVSAGTAAGQAGPRVIIPSKERGASLSITAARGDDASPGPITSKQMTLYEDGIEHPIQSVSPDPSPARIVLLVDNSRSLRFDVEKMAATLREFAYEIYEGDQLMIVGFDEKAEILTEWTDDAKKIEASLKTLRKQGEPFLFDALRAVVDQALTPIAATTQKRVIIVVSDGLDRGSKTKFAEILGDLQRQDITLYAYQIPDRTGGALRRDQPKPAQVVEQLTGGTGGRVLSAIEPRESARAVCDELRNNRYTLSYSPTHISYTDARRLLIVPDQGVAVRHKLMQQPPR